MVPWQGARELLAAHGGQGTSLRMGGGQPADKLITGQENLEAQRLLGEQGHCLKLPGSPQTKCSLPLEVLLGISFLEVRPYSSPLSAV